jgi:hypothetical protein
VFLPGGEGSDRPARAVAQPVAAARMPGFWFFALPLVAARMFVFVFVFVFALPLVAARMPGARRHGGGAQILKITLFSKLLYIAPSIQ